MTDVPLSTPPAVIRLDHIALAGVSPHHVLSEIGEEWETARAYLNMKGQ